MDSLNSDCFLSTASSSEQYFFSVKKNMDALISASTPFLMLVTGCNKLIHRKKNQMNPPLNLFSLPAERRLPEILWSVVLHNFFTITPQNPFPWLPHWFLCDVSHLETCPRLFRYHWCILYVLRIYLYFLTSKRQVQSACYFPGNSSVLDSSYCCAVSPTFSTNRVYSTSQKHVSWPFGQDLSFIF